MKLHEETRRQNDMIDQIHQGLEQLLEGAKVRLGVMIGRDGSDRVRGWLGRAGGWGGGDAGPRSGGGVARQPGHHLGGWGRKGSGSELPDLLACSMI